MRSEPRSLVGGLRHRGKYDVVLETPIIGMFIIYDTVMKTQMNSMNMLYTPSRLHYNIITIHLTTIPELPRPFP